MKGIIFTEFLDLVEEKFGFPMVDKIIQQSKLQSEGAYTAVGTYEFSEMLQLLSNLSNNTNISVDDLLMVYSDYLFKALIKAHPNLVEMYKDPMTLLASIESHIHVEVLKIYPDAQLPTFIIEERTDSTMSLIYKSDRALYMLGKGLMLNTFKLFNKEAKVDVEKLNEQGTEVRYLITML